MKVWQRILIKSVVLVLVIAVAGGGVAGWRAYQQSTAQYAIDRYLSFLIEDSSDRAYTLLDQSEETEMSEAEYAAVTEAKKYGLYSSYTVDELETRLDSSGNQYVDFRAEFMDADNEVQATEDFVVKKQAEAVFGIFDKWKVMSGHCMVKNFALTVPADSEVYVNGEKADTTWIVQGETKTSADTYQIPSMIPGQVSLTIRHAALESVNTTLDATAGSADFTGEMALKETAKSECLEMGIRALEQLYSGAATESAENLDELLEACKADAETFIEDQGGEFNREDSVFRTAAVSEYATEFGDPVFEGNENGAITVEMSLTYHYVVQRDVTTDTEEYDADGNLVQETNTQSDSGENTARFTMAFSDGEWHIAAMEVPQIPQ